MQIPRLYNVYKAQGLLDSFEQMIENIFLPLFEVTADPVSHPQLHIFLQQARPACAPRCTLRRHALQCRRRPCACLLAAHPRKHPMTCIRAAPAPKTPKSIRGVQVVGFDCVDDESKPERRPTKSMPPPAQWNTKYNAAYSYYTYYLYANLYTLNKFRCACARCTGPHRELCSVSCSTAPEAPEAARGHGSTAVTYVWAH